jgi:hypothetical protein
VSWFRGGSSADNEDSEKADIYFRMQLSAERDERPLTLPFCYPLEEESIPIPDEKHTYFQTNTLDPKIKFPTPIGSGSLSLFSRTKQDMFDGIPRISRVGKGCNNVDLQTVQIGW